MEDDQEVYRVVVNLEEQYSIWPEYREIPQGWKDVGVSGPKDKCLDHIEKVWTDMRPLSLRKKMEEWRNNPPPEPMVAEEPESEEETLVERLSTGRHPVEVSLRPKKELSRFKECLDRGYVQIKFTGTRGGTELGVRLNEETDLSKANFEAGAGEARLAGTLTLDFVKVHCYATVNLSDLAGEGYLVPVAS